MPGYPWQRRRFWVDSTVDTPVPRSRPVVGSGPVYPAGTDLTGYLVERVAEALGMAPDEVDPARPPAEAGLDSLLAARVRARINRELGSRLSVRDLLGADNLTRLAAGLSRSADARQPGPAEAVSS